MLLEENVRRAATVRKVAITDAFQESRTALVKLVKEADETALSRLVMNCALLDSAYHEASSSDDRLPAAARKRRIDVDALARAVRDEFATKAKKAVAKAKKPTNGTTKTAAAV